MNIDLTSGIVRILAPGSATAGTGFVVTDDGFIITCAHVVEAARAKPGDIVRVVFHTTGEEREAQVERDWWRGPDAEDVAILHLDGSSPGGVTPLCLGNSTGVEGHVLATFGFPDPKPVEGMAGKCEVVGRTTERGFPVLQLRSSEVTPGFSGAPVLDTITRRVVGVVTAITIPDQYGRLAETAFIIPTETLRAVYPELQLSDLCPYQGLAAFTEDHTEFFFGREKLVADLVDHLRGNPRFLAVVGPSGSGKSSVVQAGLLPALRRGEIPNSADWHLLSFRPGTDSFAALAAAGLDVSQESDLPTTVRAFLEAHPQVKRLVLFADQFEELFTLCPQPVQERFLHQLAALLEGNLSVTVVLTLRADFYGHLLRYRPLVDWLKIGQVNVPPMGPEELRATVEEPALRLGLRFDPGLVEIIVEEADQADHPLPLLESALTQLWERREDGVLTHAAYQAVGQVAGAIGQWAEDAYAELAPEERLLARRVFTRLVRYGEGEVADTRQQQSLSELVARPEEQEFLHRLVRRLADARLLVTGGDLDAETVEIIHDALLQQWGHLKHWTAEQREFYLWRQRLDERLQEWEEQKQDEGALLHGALLTEAERWLAERPDDLNLDEVYYIQTSLSKREQEQLARERLRRWIALVAVGAAVVFSVLTVVIGRLWRQSEERRQIAVARQLAAQAQIELGNTGSGPIQSVLLATESLRRYPCLQADQTLRRGMDLLRRPMTWMEHSDVVHSVAFSPNGQWVASGSADGTAKVWNAVTGENVTNVEHQDEVVVVAFSPDGRWGASGSLDGIVRVWETTTGKDVAQIVHEYAVWNVIFNSDGRLMATRSNTVQVWETATWEKVLQMEHERGVNAVAFSPDGQWIVSANQDGTVRVSEVTTGKEIASVAHEEPVYAVGFSPDGQWVVSGDELGTVSVWGATTGRSVAQMKLEHYVCTLTFSPDGQWVASGNVLGTVVVWEAFTERRVARMEYEGNIPSVIFSPDGRWVAAAGGRTIQVWEATTGQEVARMAHKDEVSAVIFSPDGRWVVSGSLDKTVRVWDMTIRQEVARMEHDSEVSAIAFAPDGQQIMTGGVNKTTLVWDVISGQEVARMVHNSAVWDVLLGPDGRQMAIGGSGNTVWVWDIAGEQSVIYLEHEGVSTAAFSPDGRWVASGGEDRLARVWEVATGREVVRMVHEDAVSIVAFSPDGQWVASGSGGWLRLFGENRPIPPGEVRVWKATTGQELARMKHQGVIDALAFSSDGRWVASGSNDGTARVWEVATGREVAGMKHEGPVLALAFSPDGQWVASGGMDNTVRLWEAATGQEVARMAHEDEVRAVAFSPDGRWVVSGSLDKTARVWLWRPDDLIAEACARLPRNLTREEWRMYLGDEPYRATCPNLPVPEE